MTNELDLGRVHQNHEPDPAFVSALEQRLEATLVGATHLDDSSGGHHMTIDAATEPLDRHRRRWVVSAAALVGAAAVIAVIVVVTSGGPSKTASPTSLTFAEAIEASGVLTSPSADEAVQAKADDLEETQTEVSAAGNYVSLRRCRVEPDYAVSTCSFTGWAYVTGVAGDVEMHGGLLGEASQVDLDLHLLDDRYFVASESSPDAQAPSRAWLIDSVSGKAGALSWRDEPTTLNSPEQALLLCQETSYYKQCAVAHVWDDINSRYVGVPTEGGLPKVVDARDGTIRPLAMPDDVAGELTVAQHGTGRIWVGTDPDGDGLGLAHSDDGGATWTEVALPEQLRSSSEDGYGVAADGDRVAVTSGWVPNGGTVYVSDDAGQSWTIATLQSEPEVEVNLAHLWVLADGRLVLMWSSDASPVQLLVSTGSDWAELEKVDRHVLAPETQWGSKRFSVNRAGIALIRSFNANGSGLDKIEFSTDLTSWSTIESLND